MKIKTFFLILVLFCSCYAPYSFRVKPVESQEHKILLVMQLTSKFPYVVLHDSINAWKLTGYKLNADNSFIEGHLDLLPTSRTTFHVVNENKINKAQRGYDKPFDEMHIWVKSQSWNTGDKIQIFEKDLIKVQVYQAARSGGASAGILIGVLAGALLVGALIWVSVTFTGLN